MYSPQGAFKLFVKVFKYYTFFILCMTPDHKNTSILLVYVSRQVNN